MLSSLRLPPCRWCLLQQSCHLSLCTGKHSCPSFVFKPARHHLAHAAVAAPCSNLLSHIGLPCHSGHCVLPSACLLRMHKCVCACLLCKATLSDQRRPLVGRRRSEAPAAQRAAQGRAGASFLTLRDGTQATSSMLSCSRRLLGGARPVLLAGRALATVPGEQVSQTWACRRTGSLGQRSTGCREAGKLGGEGQSAPPLAAAACGLAAAAAPSSTQPLALLVHLSLQHSLRSTLIVSAPPFESTHHQLCRSTWASGCGTPPRARCTREKRCFTERSTQLRSCCTKRSMQWRVWHTRWAAEAFWGWSCAAACVSKGEGRGSAAGSGRGEGSVPAALLLLPLVGAAVPNQAPRSAQAP